MKNLREVSKEAKRSDGLDTGDKNKSGQADSTKKTQDTSELSNGKFTTVNNTKTTKTTDEEEVVHSPNNNDEYVSRDVEVKI